MEAEWFIQEKKSGRHSRAEGYLSEGIFKLLHEVFDHENDDKMSIGYVYYDYYHTYDRYTSDK